MTKSECCNIAFAKFIQFNFLTENIVTSMFKAMPWSAILGVLFYTSHVKNCIFFL